MRRVNYDEIADRYDDTRREPTVDRNLLRFLKERQEAPEQTSARVLDIGCGTGRQLALNRSQCPNAVLLGIDVSAAMLEIARRRCPSAHWLHGDGAALPLRTGSVVYATSQFSYAHIRRQKAFLTEVLRVLHPGGRLAITSIDPWSMPGWLYYRYFPAAQALDHQNFIPVEGFSDLLRDLGFVGVQAARSDRSSTVTLSAFLAGVSQRHSASQLMAIPDAEYEGGLRQLRQDIEAARGGQAVRSEFVLVTLTADKPTPSA